jgi:NADH-quinone oxidoreductase subunit G
MAKLIIDGKTHEIKEHRNILEAALSLGYDLPYFCWHPALGSVGSCRQCAVIRYRDENDKKGKLVMACMEPATDGTSISLNDPESHQFRKNVVESLMTNHPHDCPVCDEGGECHLQDMTVMTGHNYRRFNYNKRTHRNQYLGPFINHEMNRCIQCYRCVRFYREYAEGEDFNVFAAHNHVYFGRYQEGVLENEFSGNLIEVCPTGVFTDKTLKKHYTRKWDLTMAPSLCVHCGLGCNTIAGERYGSLRRILSRYNHEVNGYFICDRGRFGYEFVNHPGRIRSGKLRDAGGKQEEIRSAEEIFSRADEMISKSRTIIGIGSPRASLESNFALKLLVGDTNFYAGITEEQFSMLGKIQEILKGPVRTPSLEDIRGSDAVLVLGEDLTNTAPMMALAIRKAARNKPLKKAIQLGIPSWQDAAVRELMQEDRGALTIATPAPTKLDPIATTRFRGNAEEIVQLGFEIAREIDPDVPAAGKGKRDQNPAADIVRGLMEAENPVIISGISLMNGKVLEAAANIAWALHKKNKKCSLAFVVPESNSMGLRMMTDQSLDDFRSDKRKNADLMIILENDLFFRLGKKSAEDLRQKTEKWMVLEHTENPTTKKADLVIPVGTFAEAEGTIINQEGRAQRFYQVFVPSSLILPGWRRISCFSIFKEHIDGHFSTFDDFVNRLAEAHPSLSSIRNIAPPASYRKNGQKIARETLRYSGRTAMHANIKVSEPKPPQDPDSPLTYTMEGYHGKPPSSIIPYFWSPGWNSQQSINKFQIEVGGPLHGGDPGIRLFKPEENATFNYFEGVTGDGKGEDTGLVAEPGYHIFGSEELSRLAGGIAKLIPAPYIGMSPKTAEKEGFKDGDKVSLEMDLECYEVDLKLIQGMADETVLVPIGLGDLPWFIFEKKVHVKKSGS